MPETENKNEGLLLNKGTMVEKLLEERPGDFASKAAADRVVRSVFAMMGECLAAGGTVRIQDFGTFELASTQARTGRNPQTNEPIEIPAGTKVRFRAAAALKEAVNH